MSAVRSTPDEAIGVPSGADDVRDIPVLIMGGAGQPSWDERQDRRRIAARLATGCPPNELAIGLRRLLDATR